MKPLISKGISIALLGVLFLTIFNFTLTNMAAPYIAGSLGASNDIATYTITFFALGNAMGLPLSRICSVKFGSVTFLIICLLLFAIFSYLCTVSTSYAQIVVMRFFQGFAAGPLFPLVSRILSSLNPPEKKQSTTSCIILISAITPVFGASWGGCIAYEYHWNWIFYLNLPFLILLTPLFYFTLKDKPIEIPDSAFNPIGYISYCSWVLCLGSAITLGQFLDWHRSSIIIALFAVGTFSFFFYLLWDLRHPHPIVHLQLFKKFSFSLAMTSLAGLFSAYFGMVLLLGLWLTLDVNYTPVWIALLIGSMSFAGLVLSFLIPTLERMDPRIPLCIAVVFFAVSCFYTTNFSVDINFGRIATSRILAGFGLAFFLAPLFRMAFASLNHEETNDGVVIFQIVRSIASGLGASIYTTVWWRRSVFFYERLGSDLTAFSQETKFYFGKAAFFDIKGLKADAKLQDLLTKQAKALALDDSFYLMAWVCVILLIGILLTLLRKTPLIEKST
jgi:DHA2 family multidrug resistance protein